MNNVVLVGFMGTGKSTVGPLLAERLGRPFVDLDEVIVADAGRPISDIFMGEGEQGFRQREARCLEQALRATAQVIAVGGGAPMSSSNWERLRTGNVVVALTAEPQTLMGRLNGASSRPLLAMGAEKAIETLLPRRMPRYLQADLVVRSDQRLPEALADEISRVVPGRSVDRIAIDIEGASHEMTVGRHLSHLVEPALTRAGARGRVALVSDETVDSRHAPAIEAALRASGRRVSRHVLPAGERAKRLEEVARLYDGLAASGIDRTGGLVALGGGAVGDVAGFAAATWLRGIPFVQVPTTLLAMVDSSIGGKTGVNLGAGKNLVGAVHQPCAIICDLDLLDTLPHEDYRSAFAEILKCGLIADAVFFAWLRLHHPALLERDPSVLQEAITRAAAIKARIVAADPDETSIRALLNYGHTVGHALEAATGYGALRHGDAVAWGLQVAGHLSVATGRCDSSVLAAQREALEAYGFLGQPPRVSREALLAAIRHDKKGREGEPRWVLLNGIGLAEHGCVVEPGHVEAALQAVLG